MKKLEMNQMESLNGQGWGMLACKVGLIGVGALAGPGGALAGAIAGNILCMPYEAH